MDQELKYEAPNQEGTVPMSEIQNDILQFILQNLLGKILGERLNFLDFEG